MRILYCVDMDALTEAAVQSSHDIVRATWQATMSEEFDRGWRRALPSSCSLWRVSPSRGPVRLMPPGSCPSFSVTSRLSGKGTLRAPESGVEPLRLQQFEAPFTLEDDRLVFEPTVFTVHKGTHRGAVAFGEQLEQRMDASLKGLDVRIEENHFIEALLPAWKLKEKHA